MVFQPFCQPFAFKDAPPTDKELAGALVDPKFGCVFEKGGAIDEALKSISKRNKELDIFKALNEAPTAGKMIETALVGR